MYSTQSDVGDESDLQTAAGGGLSECARDKGDAAQITCFKLWTWQVA